MGTSHSSPLLQDEQKLEEVDFARNFENYRIQQALPPGSGRMFKGCLVRDTHLGNTMVVKTMHVQLQNHQAQLQQEIAELQRIKQALEDSPHVAPFLFWKVGTSVRPEWTPLYIMRTHVYTTLSDRLASRPFLHVVEKLWITRQLLQVVQHLHDSQVVHGFITTENIGLTSWNYVILLDLASYKQVTQLPDDDPSLYLYYFQEQLQHTISGEATNTTTTSRAEKRCYLAPERFYTPSRTGTKTTLAENQDESSNTLKQKLTPASDIFSVGCVIVETFLNGERAMDLGDLMEYRSCQKLSQFSNKLNKIESSSLRAACRHMLHLNPNERKSASDYLQRLQASNVMPGTFEVFSEFFEKVTYSKQVVISSDARIAMAAMYYGRIVYECLGIRDVEGEAYFERVLGKTVSCHVNDKEGQHYTDAEKETEKVPKQDNEKEMDGLLQETQDLLSRLDSMTLDSADLLEKDEPPAEETASQEPTCNQQDSGNKKPPSPADKSSLLLFLQLVLVTIRHVQRPSSKFVGLQLLLRLGYYSTDDARLQRIVPTTIALLHDQDALIRASAIRVLVQTCASVQTFAPSDSKVFPQYIFKRVVHLLTDPSLVVRVAFSECIPVLAETALRFLDISHAVRLYEAVGGSSSTPLPDSDETKETVPPNVFADDVAKLLGDDLKNKKRNNEENDDEPESLLSQQDSQKVPPVPVGGKTLISNTYNAELGGLHEIVSRWVVHIATDQSEQSSPPKLGLLRDLPRLCNFFGRDGVIAFILPQILAFLNDRRDWQLRASLFEHLPSVCYIVGRAATEHFVLPCLETALVDGEDLVMSQALLCLSALVELGLLSRSALVGTPAYSMIADERGVQPHYSGSANGGNSGLFEKYAPLLLYPSEHVRHGAISFVNSSCQALGFPDRNVFLVPLLRPFLKFEPSAHHLTTPEGLKSCLVPPWTREMLRQELDQLSRLQAFSPTSGKWTSIGIDVTDKDGIGQEPGTGEPGNVSSPSDRMTQSLRQQQQGASNFDQVVGYLRMMSKSRKLVLDPRSEKELLNSRLANAIEGSLKLAQHIKFPNQKYAGLMPAHIPSWYTDLQDYSLNDKSYCSESCAITSVSSLTKVYGLSLIHPATATEEDKAALDASLSADGDVFPDDKKLTDEEAKKVLTSTESRIIEAASAGEWGAEATLDPVNVDTMLLTTKLKGLRVPPLPPNLGVLQERPPPTPSPRPGGVSPRDSSGKERSVDGEWKPKSDALVASSSAKSGHSAPVARLAVSRDQGFFVSASHDGTCKAWELRKTEASVGILESSVTYSGHADGANHAYPRINDVAIVENSHSVVSGASDGTVHCWRVDMVSTSKHPTDAAAPTADTYETPRVSGSSVIRKINPDEGEVLSVSHFNTPSASVLSFATQKGLIHSWDLRSAKEPFVLNHRPDIGYLTSMALGNDRHWMVTGTSRGYLALWDVRFQQIVKLWQHSSASPVNRLATSFSAPHRNSGHNMSSADARPYIFAACGPNECSMFDVVDNTCCQCFRVIEPGTGYMDPPATTLPTIRAMPITASYHSQSTRSHRRLPGSFDYVSTSIKPRMTGMVGSVGSTTRDYLITGGSDCQIRYFDFLSPAKCYTISGGQQRPTFERVDFDYGRLITCRENPALRIGEIESSKLPRKLKRGLTKPETKHHDSITDLKMISYPMRTLLSCSSDGAIKLWR